jgi:hypothetical protein
MERAVLDVVDGAGVVATVRIEGSRAPDAFVLDAVARLALAAGRLGWSVRLRDPAQTLAEVVALAGLGDVLRGEPRGQAERREQGCVEEVVQPDEPVA